MSLNDKSLLVTGGTGSFGKKFIEIILKRFPRIKRLVIFSRDELKQYEMAQIYNPLQYPQVRFFIGDIRDKNRIKRALEGIDIVVHAAALKQVPTAEYNPFECINTNILGAQNLIESILDSRVTDVVALSTDKAAAPVNLYGATKLCSDKLFIAANNIKGSRTLKFSVVRYGNVMGSRGSVIPFFLSKRNSGHLPITDPEMTRFSITLSEGVDLVIEVLDLSLGGEIFVPKIPSYNICDLAKAIGPNCKQSIVGIRPGEKIHEEMVTISDAQSTIETDNYFIIIPNLLFESRKKVIERYLKHYNGRMVDDNFSYNSGTNKERLSVEMLRHLIKENIDPNFEVVR